MQDLEDAYDRYSQAEDMHLEELQQAQQDMLQRRTEQGAPQSVVTDHSHQLG